MSKTLNTNLAWIAAPAAAACVWALLSPPVSAQTATNPPPIRDNIDANGVDVVTVKFNLSTTEVAVGVPGAGGMAYTRSYYDNGWGDNYTGGISITGPTVIVTIGRKSEKFTQSGSTYIAAQALGSTLTYSAAVNRYTYTTADGTTALFGTVSTSPTFSWGVITSLLRPNGEVLTFNYVSATLCVGTCDPQNQLHRLQSVTNNFGYQIRFNYQLGGSTVDYNSVPFWMEVSGVTAINMAVDYCDPLAYGCSGYTVNWPTVTYAKPDANTRTVTDLLGNVTKYIYAGNLLTGIRKPSSPSANSITINYDTSGNGLVTSITNGTGTWQYARTDNGTQRTTTVTDPMGHTRVFNSSVPDLLVNSMTNGVGKTTSFTYDAAGRMTRMTLPEGGYVQYTLDLRGNTTQTRQVSKTPGTPADIVTSAGYDSTCTSPLTCNKPIYTIDAMGNRTDYTYYWATGDVLTITQPAALAGGVRPQTRFTYSPLFAWYKNSSGGIVQSLTGTYHLTQISTCATQPSCAGTGDEITTTLTYGSSGVGNNLLATSLVKANGAGTVSSTTTTTYNAVGDVASVDGPIPGNADTTVKRYDVLRRLVGTISPDPDGPGPLLMRATRLTYNVDGQVTATEQGSVTANDATWNNNFTVLAKQTTTYDSLGRKIQDAAIAVPGTSTAAMRQYRYDAANRLECIAVRMNASAFGSQPDACTLGTAGTDGPDRITRFTYDTADRVTVQTVGYGTAAPIDSIAVTYTGDGQRSTLMDGAGRLSTFEYDGHDRLQTLRYPQANNGAVSSTTDYDQLTYNAASNVTQFRRRDGQIITLGYDGLNRLRTKTPPVAADAVTYGYDNVGRLISATTVSQTVSYSYDALDQVTSEGGPEGTSVSTWDSAGRRTRLTWPDGFFVNYDYDALNEVTAIRENGATSGAGVLATFGYDDLGRRTSLTRGNGVSTAYAYDVLSRPTSLTHNLSGTANDQSYTLGYNAASQIKSQSTTNQTYDYNGTRVDVAYGVNGLNQLTNAAGTLTYDARGNLTSDGTRTYGFDAQDHLVSTSGSPSVTLSYDPVDRLFQTAAASTTRFAYDGSNLAGEYSGSDAMQRRYVYGPGVDEPLVWYEGNGTTDRRWMVADPRGSIIAVTNGTGAATQLGRYDDYGAPGTSNPGRFQYTGQMWLPEAGLYHYKARAYQPKLRRFLQPDPIRYDGGPNVYAYADDDPINTSDPSGLFPICTTFYGEYTSTGYVLDRETGESMYEVRVVARRGEVCWDDGNFAPPPQPPPAPVMAGVGTIMVPQLPSQMQQCMKDRMGALGWAIDGIADLLPWIDDGVGAQEFLGDLTNDLWLEYGALATYNIGSTPGTDGVQAAERAFGRAARNARILSGGNNYRQLRSAVRTGRSFGRSVPTVALGIAVFGAAYAGTSAVICAFE